MCFNSTNSINNIRKQPLGFPTALKRFCSKPRAVNQNGELGVLKTSEHQVCNRFAAFMAIIFALAPWLHKEIRVKTRFNECAMDNAYYINYNYKFCMLVCFFFFEEVEKKQYLSALLFFVVFNMLKPCPSLPSEQLPNSPFSDHMNHIFSQTTELPVSEFCKLLAIGYL